MISVDSAATYLRQEALLSRDGTFFGLDRLQVLAQVSEEDLPRLNALKPEQRRWNIRPKAGAPAVQGWIEEIGDWIDPNQHTAVATGFLDNHEGRLRAGQFITASVTLPSPAGDLVVPAGAIVEEGYRTFVFVQPDAKKFFYELRRIAIVRRGQDVVPIRSRLSPEQERRDFRRCVWENAWSRPAPSS